MPGYNPSIEYLRRLTTLLRVYATFTRIIIIISFFFFYQLRSLFWDIFRSYSTRQETTAVQYYEHRSEYYGIVPRQCIARRSSSYPYVHRSTSGHRTILLPVIRFIWSIFAGGHFGLLGISIHNDVYYEQESHCSSYNNFNFNIV